MKPLRRAVEWAAYLVCALLGAALTLLGSVGKISGSGNFQVEILPWWTGQQLVNVLLGAGLSGLAATLLAALGKLRVALPLWMLAVLVATAWGMLFTNHKFAGSEHFRESLLILLVLALTFAVSVSQAVRKA